MIVRAFGIVLLSALGCAAQERTATLVGTVNDPFGSPMENAKVQIDSDAINIGPYTVKTDNFGNFRFAGVPPQTYRLEISVAGFETWRKAGIRLLADQQTSLGEAFLILGTMCRKQPSVDFIQRSASGDGTGTLRGSVIDSSGSPVVEARISLKHCSKCVTKTNREGQFIFSNLTQNHYTLNISMKGFYREILRDLFVAKSMSWTYSPVQLESCPAGDYGQTARPQKPLELCF